MQSVNYVLVLPAHNEPFHGLHARIDQLIARQDDEGTFFFVGRRKQIIRRSGKNISAAEVESVLTLARHELQAAVVPVPDPVREEEVFACVVTDSQLQHTHESAEALLQQAAERLFYFKLPAYIAFVSALPTTATQKLRYGAKDKGSLTAHLQPRRP